MEYEYEIPFGRISKINGYEASISVKLEKAFIDNIPEMVSVFLEIEGKPVPFFISHFDYIGGDTIRLQFDGYRNAEKLKEFSGCNIFLTTVPPDYKQPESYQGLTGFAITSLQDEIIGWVKDIINNPGQTLLSVKSEDGNEILIPFHENFIVKINWKKKLIVMDLPEGLEDINK